MKLKQYYKTESGEVIQFRDLNAAHHSKKCKPDEILLQDMNRVDQKELRQAIADDINASKTRQFVDDCKTVFV